MLKSNLVKCVHLFSLHMYTAACTAERNTHHTCESARITVTCSSGVLAAEHNNRSATGQSHDQL